MITTLIEREAEPILISDLTWREFKAVEQLIDRPGLRLSFLDGVLEIRKMRAPFIRMLPFPLLSSAPSNTSLTVLTVTKYYGKKQDSLETDKRYFSNDTASLSI